MSTHRLVRGSVADHRVHHVSRGPLWVREHESMSQQVPRTPQYNRARAHLFKNHEKYLYRHFDSSQMFKLQRFKLSAGS